MRSADGPSVQLNVSRGGQKKRRSLSSMAAAPEAAPQEGSEIASAALGGNPSER